MHDTHDIDAVAAALLDLLGALNSPRQDDILLAEAGVSIDRALFPLLVRIGAAGRLSVAELADLVGRDHSTISRQTAKLESLGLIDRRPATQDQRVRVASLSHDGAAHGSRHQRGAATASRQAACRLDRAGSRVCGAP